MKDPVFRAIIRANPRRTLELICDGSTVQILDGSRLVTLDTNGIDEAMSALMGAAERMRELALAAQLSRELVATGDGWQKADRASPVRELTPVYLGTSLDVLRRAGAL